MSGLTSSYSSVQNMASFSGSSGAGDIPDTNDRDGQDEDEDQQQPLAKRPKVNYSKVHDEFTVTQVYHAKKKIFVEGRQCKRCLHKFVSVSATNLKTHLQGKSQLSMSLK